MNKPAIETQRLLFPFILVTSLFFLWGLSYGLLDVLNKHFQEVLHVNKRQSTLLQFAYFGAYFLMAVPAGFFMNRYGYKKGILAGLLLFATGALLFYPSAEVMNFYFFLFSLFILASGITFLETAANPYATVLGKPETSAFRLNLAQCFNGVGSFIGPIIGGALFFGGNDNNNNTGALDNVRFVYISIAAAVLIVAFFIFRTKLPEIKEEELVTETNEHSGKSLFQHRHFVWAVAAQFFYVAAQVGIAALFINYCTEKNLGITNEKAAYLFSGCLIIFTLGRFAGTAIMKKISAHHLLSLYAAINSILCLAVVFMQGMISIYALMAIFFFESVMFPTIFALGVKNLGQFTKKGASYIIMAIAGGALMPYVMGAVAEAYTTAVSYIVPLFCFVVVLLFGMIGYKIKSHS